MTDHSIHAIRARLYPSPLNGGRKYYYAKTAPNRTLNIDEVCHSAVTRGDADMDATAMAYAVKCYYREMEYLLCDGFAVNTGTYLAQTTVKGSFDNTFERFDPERHQLGFRFTQSARLRRKAAKLQVELEHTRDDAWRMSQVVDLKTGSINDALTPNGNLTIAGSKIKVTGDHPGVGVYFIDQSTGGRTGVDASGIVTNTHSKLLIVIPALQTGSYALEVVTQYCGAGRLLKEPDTFRFARSLTVYPPGKGALSSVAQVP